MKKAFILISSMFLTAVPVCAWSIDVSYNISQAYPGLSKEELSKIEHHALWSNDKSAFVVSIPDKNGSVIFVFIRQPTEEFRRIDISRVESGNFGKLGSKRSYYDRFETLPVKWLTRDDGLYQVEIRTQAWKGGRRFTVSEALLLSAEGKVYWR